ncbi:acyltransferase family protein [Paenibacillus sp. MMS18-CY102]|uniref:acyltransferase family protein n=1 Tax=Paenibacillus sp. MMS18-CY102 TaxID=2682849 RepID=UPI001365BF23|nr:acyltransferase [Paenibacillus sp. MMS18-CY102]MWC30718.1 acyltransferase family protein [Paenibacillus sp. MMS18-CY102]
MKGTSGVNQLNSVDARSVAIVLFSNEQYGIIAHSTGSVNMQKIKYLDGLRGLAALIVVLSHFVVAFYPAMYNGAREQVHTASAIELSITKSPLNLLYNGNFAVCIFFVLSGFVLSYKFFQTKDNEVLVESAVKRYFRLMIPVLASIALVVILSKLALFYNNEASVTSFSTWWLGSFWNFDMTLGHVINNAFYGVFFNSNADYNTVLWTMTYEMYGSLLVFGLAAIFGRVKKRYLFYIAAILLLFKTYYVAFVLGMMISDFHNNNGFKHAFFRNPFVNVVLACVGLFLGSYPSGSIVKGSVYGFIEANAIEDIVLYHIAGAFLILVALLNTTKIQHLLSTRLFVFLGKISFSLYLIHVIVIGSLTSFVFIHMAGYVGYSTAVFLSGLLTLPIMLIISYFMYKYVDYNGIKLANKIYSRIFKRDLDS